MCVQPCKCQRDPKRDTDKKKLSNRDKWCNAQLLQIWDREINWEGAGRSSHQKKDDPDGERPVQSPNMKLYTPIDLKV